MNETINMTDQKRTLIFINLLITCIATSFLATALSTALPPVASALQVDIATGQWLTSAYSLVMGIVMPLTAFLITRFPTKNLYLTAIVLFLAGTLVCIFAANFPIMMVGRIMQACSNGIITAMVQVVLLTIYPPEKQGTIMGWYGLCIGASPVIAPTFAGVLVDTLGWRMIFIIPCFIVLCSLICTIFMFDNVLETKPRKFDVISFVLSVFAFGGLTLGVGNISAYGITAPVAFIPLLLGFVGAILFIWRQFSISQPFLELRVFRHKRFTIAVIGSILLYLVMMGGSLLIPLYVQSVMGYSATVSGLVTLPGSLAMAIVSPLAGKIYDKMGMKKLAVVGSLCMVLSNGGMVLVTLGTPLIVAVLLNAVRSIAIGCLLMPFVTWGIGGIEGENKAHGSALITSLRTIAGAIGSALFVGVMNTVSVNSMAAHGANAQIHGLNVAFLWMTAATLILFMVSVVMIKPKKN